MIDRGRNGFNDDNEDSSYSVPDLPFRPGGFGHCNSERDAEGKGDRKGNKPQFNGNRSFFRNDFRDGVACTVLVGSAEVSAEKLPEIIEDLNRSRILKTELLQSDINLRL